MISHRGIPVFVLARTSLLLWAIDLIDDNNIIEKKKELKIINNKDRKKNNSSACMHAVKK